MVIYTYFTKPIYPMTDFEAKITDMFLHSASFDFLASETGEISDEQMVVYAAHNMPNYDWDNGNTRAQFESLTMKYFGKTLSDYTINDWFEYIPGTDRLVPTGWSIGASPNWVILSEPLKKDGDIYTGIFDCYTICCLWEDAPYSWEEAEQFFTNKDWKPFFENGCAIETLEIIFSLGQEEDGSYYPIYHSVKYISQYHN